MVGDSGQRSSQADVRREAGDTVQGDDHAQDLGLDFKGNGKPLESFKQRGCHD